jgi:hypothetical protein
MQTNLLERVMVLNRLRSVRMNSAYPIISDDNNGRGERQSRIPDILASYVEKGEYVRDIPIAPPGESEGSRSGA